MDNLLRIGDFSRLAQVSVPTLRHYDDLGLLKPSQVDRFTDYRYYALEQLPRLNRILALKDLGLSLDQIKQLLMRQMPADHLRQMLAEKRATLEKQLREEQARLARVEARLRQIEHEGEPGPQFDVVIKAIEAQFVVTSRQLVSHISQMPERRKEAIDRLYGWVDQMKINPLGAELFQYFNEGWTEDDIDMGAGVLLEAKLGRALLESGAGVSAGAADGRVVVMELAPAKTVACITHHGPIWDIPVVIAGLYTWIANNGYHSVGPIREMHLNWRECEIEEDQPLIFEIQLPVERDAS